MQFLARAMVLLQPLAIRIWAQYLGTQISLVETVRGIVVIFSVE